METESETPTAAPSMGATPPSAPSAADLQNAAAAGAKAFKEAVPSGGTFGGKGHSELKEALVELQAWDMPFNSAMVVAGVSALYYLTTGPEAYQVLTLLCLAILVRLGVVKLTRKALAGLEGNEKAVAVRNLVEGFALRVESVLPVPSPPQVNKLVVGFAELVESRSNKVCKLLVQASEPTPEGEKAFKVAIGHVVPILISLRFMSTWTLLYVYVMYQMTWPPVYQRNKAKVDEIFAKGAEKARPYAEKARVKASELGAKAGEAGHKIGAAAFAKINVGLEKAAEAYQKRFPAKDAKPAEKTE